MTISALGSTLIKRLSELRTPEADQIIDQFKKGYITAQQLIADASALFRLTRVDQSGALTRSAALHMKPVFIPDRVYEGIFGKTERGERVTATEAFILKGDLDPEVLRHA